MGKELRIMEDSLKKQLIISAIVILLVLLLVIGINLKCINDKLDRLELYDNIEKKEDSPITESKNITDNGDLLFVDSYIPPTSIIFGDDIGRLSWEDGKMKFEGDAYESAKIFFDYFLIMYIDEYIEARISALSIDEPEMILFEFVAEGEFAKEFRPQLFLKITNVDMSKCLIGDNLRIKINDEKYWIRLEKDRYLPYMPGVD